MNDLSETITSFLLVRDILRDAGDNPKMVQAALTLLEHYIAVQDDAFVEAWNEVIKKPKTQYTDEELDAMCDAAEKEQIYKNYRAAIDEYNKLNEKYKELTACHIELQDLFYKVDAELDELKVKYDRVQKDYHTVVTNIMNGDKEYDC